MTTLGFMHDWEKGKGRRSGRKNGQMPRSGCQRTRIWKRKKEEFPTVVLGQSGGGKEGLGKKHGVHGRSARKEDKPPPPKKKQTQKTPLGVVDAAKKGEGGETDKQAPLGGGTAKKKSGQGRSMPARTAPQRGRGERASHHRKGRGGWKGHGVGLRQGERKREGLRRDPQGEEEES